MEKKIKKEKKNFISILVKKKRGGEKKRKKNGNVRTFNDNRVLFIITESFRF